MTFIVAVAFLFAGLVLIISYRRATVLSVRARAR
jgi:hypothetical protein